MLIKAQVGKSAPDKRQQIKIIDIVMLKNLIVNFTLKKIKQQIKHPIVCLYFEDFITIGVWDDKYLKRASYTNRKSAYIILAKEAIEDLGFTIIEEKTKFKILQTHALGSALLWKITIKKATSGS